MNTPSSAKPAPKRRRFTSDFKASIVAACLKPGVSVSRIALDNRLNANMVRRWMRESQRSDTRFSTPAFVPVKLPVPALSSDTRSLIAIRIEIPRTGGAVVVEWPAEQAHQCATLLRDLLR
ncbi:MAG: transposase [Gammaproteobacteria bacterium]|nr:transposase [Gammaproteobacteria bacterium]